MSPVVENIHQTRQPRGKITDERAWWILTHYDLDFELDIKINSLKTLIHNI
jgi:hypothetical protein